MRDEGRYCAPELHHGRRGDERETDDADETVGDIHAEPGCPRHDRLPRGDDQQRHDRQDQARPERLAASRVQSDKRQPLYFDRTVLLARSQPRASALAERLAAARVSSFDLVSRAATPTLTFEPYALASEEREGRLVRQVWRR